MSRIFFCRLATFGTGVAVLWLIDQNDPRNRNRDALRGIGYAAPYYTASRNCCPCVQRITRKKITLQ